MSDNKETVEYFVHYSRTLPPQATEIIKKYEVVNELYGLKMFFFYGVWAACIYGLMTYEAWWMKVVAMVLISQCIHGLGLFMHEALHLHMSKRNWINHFIGLFSGAPLLIAYSGYQFTHMRHHTYLRSKDDPDELFNADPKSIKTIFYLSFFIVTPAYVATMHTYALKNCDNKRMARWIRIELTALVLALVGLSVASYMGGWGMLFLWSWFFPYCLAVVFANVRAISEHGMTGKTPVSMARTVISNSLTNFIYSGENYHTVHHLAPKVPGWALKAVHDQVRPWLVEAGLIETRGYLRVAIDAWKHGPYWVQPSVKDQEANKAVPVNA